MATTLTRTDWIKAGFRILAQSGPKAVRVDILCRDLGVTKGSFYWHFTDLAALKAAMAAQWRRDATGDVVAAMTSAELTPRELFIRLIEHGLARATDDSGAPGIEAVMRHWAAGDAAVEAAVREAETERIAFFTLQLRGAGLGGPEARSRAAFLSATLVGLEQLAGEPGLPRLDVPGFIDAMLAPSATAPGAPSGSLAPADG